MDISITELLQIGISVKNQNWMANSVDPDETAHYEPSHQDLHWSQISGLVFRIESINIGLGKYQQGIFGEKITKIF